MTRDKAINRLCAALEAAEQRLEGCHRKQQQTFAMFEEQHDRAERAEAECDRLRAALTKYGKHHSTCAVHRPLHAVRSCTCGLDAALAPPKEANDG